MKNAFMVLLLLIGYWSGYNHASLNYQHYLQEAARMLETTP